MIDMSSFEEERPFAKPCRDGEGNCALPSLAQQMSGAIARGDTQSVEQLREQMIDHLVRRHDD